MSMEDGERVRRVAARLSDYAVLAHDPAVPGVATDYWVLSEEHFRRVDQWLAALCQGDPAAAGAYRDLVQRPTEAGRHRVLTTAVAAVLAATPTGLSDAAAVTAEADQHIWISHHVGDKVRDSAVEDVTTPVLMDLVRGRRPGETAPGQAAEAHIVIPFRDRPGGARTRNLLACLLALRDQDEDDATYTVTVVESDQSPRSQDLVEPLVDRYLFARKDGLFNKSWTVNVGVVSDPSAAPLTCVLDADILPNRGFVRRNLHRMRTGRHIAHLPFHRFLSLDAPSSALAIRRRCGELAAEVRADELRGLLLRDVPGGCLWVRTEVFHAVGGMDERFEGWGGEDDDIVQRLGRLEPVIRFPDQILHLHHPRPVMVNPAGEPFNAHLEPYAWSAAQPYGRLDEFDVR
jgi:hypothetical protein